jgi:hypothetical protein
MSPVFQYGDLASTYPILQPSCLVSLWNAGLASQRIYGEALSREFELMRASQMRLGEAARHVAGSRDADGLAKAQSALRKACEAGVSAQLELLGKTGQNYGFAMPGRRPSRSRRADARRGKRVPQHRLDIPPGRSFHSRTASFAWSTEPWD